LSLDLLEAIVADIGIDDDSSTSGNWIAQGLAAMRKVPVDPPAATPMSVFKGENEVRLRQAEGEIAPGDSPAAKQRKNRALLWS
jgi:hypothetical protein